MSRGFSGSGTSKRLKNTLYKMAASLQRWLLDQRSDDTRIANTRLPRWLAHEYLTLVLAVVLVLLIYSNTLHAPFVFDDKQNIQDNPDIRLTELTWEGITRAAFPSRASRRVIPNISFALNYYFHQYNVPGYHLFNIIIHITTGILLYFLIKATLQIPQSQNLSICESISPSTIAFFSALIWLAHPIQTQSVTYTVQRMNSMAAMFYILALLLYVRGRLVIENQRRWLWFAGCALAWILALGSKEIAATLPFFVLLYEWYFFQGLGTAWLKRHLTFIVGASVSFVLLAFLLLGKDPWETVLSPYKHLNYTLTQRALTECRVVLYYISLLLYPHPSRLNLDHSFPLSHSLTDPLATLPSIAIITGLIGLAFCMAKRQRLISFCILWFLGNLIIESSVIGIEIIYEHRTYLPSTFISLILVALAYRYTKQKWVTVVLLCAVVTLCSVWTYERNSVWTDDVTLWRDCVEKSPRKPRVHTNLGLALEKHGKLDEAIAHYLQALRINPKLVEAHYNLGIAYGKKGMYRSAFEEIRIAKKLSSDKQWKKMVRGGTKQQMPPTPGHP